MSRISFNSVGLNLTGKTKAKITSVGEEDGEVYLSFDKTGDTKVVVGSVDVTALGISVGKSVEIDPIEFPANTYILTVSEKASKTKATKDAPVKRGDSPAGIGKIYNDF